MSSTERAPEPTMEEILASIRRIISDDEAGSVQQRATSSEYAEQVRADEAEDGAADTQMIDHLARALGGGAKPAANDDDIDDILDLTEGGSSSEDVMMADEPAAILDEVVLETESYVETRPKLDFSAAFPPQEQRPPEVAQSYEAPPSYAESAPSHEEPAQSYAEEPAIVVEMPAPEPAAAAQAVPTLDDPTTALERAIAALKAGDLAAFAREAQSDYAAPEPAYVAPEPVYAPQPEPEAPGAEFHSEPEPLSFEPEPEPTLVVEEETVIFLAEPEPDPQPEPSVPAWAAETPSWSQIVESSPEPESEPEPEPEPAPWRSEEFSWGRTTPAKEFELNPARVNGGSDHEPHDFAGPVSSKSLEDSVKEMLRPLLKQWLDENMPRVLTAALREELENSDMQRG